MRQSIEQERSAIIQAIRNQDLSFLVKIQNSKTDKKIFQEKVKDFNDILNRFFHLKLVINEIN